MTTQAKTIKLVTAIRTAGSGAAPIWPLLFFLLFIGQLGRYRWLHQDLMFPLEELRSASRLIIAAILAIWIAIILKRMKSAFNVPIYLPALLLVSFALFYSFRFTMSTGSIRDYASLAYFPLIYLAFTIGISTSDVATTRASLLRSIRAYALATAIVTATHVALRPDSVIQGGRLIGPTAHANHLGVSFALCAISEACLNDFRRRLDRWPALMATGCGFVVVLSQSRTAIFVLAIGLLPFWWAILLRASRPKIALILTVAIATTAHITNGGLIDDVEFNRILTAGNTRSESWSNMLNGFWHHPWIGSPDLLYAGLPFGENSFILAAAATGLVGFLLLSCSMTLLIMDSHRLPCGGGDDDSKVNLWVRQVLWTLLATGILEGALTQAMLPSSFFLYLAAAILTVRSSRSERQSS